MVQHCVITRSYSKGNAGMYVDKDVRWTFPSTRRRRHLYKFRSAGRGLDRKSDCWRENQPIQSRWAPMEAVAKPIHITSI